MIVLVADSSSIRPRWPEGGRLRGLLRPRQLADDDAGDGAAATRADVLVVRSTKVTAAMIDAGPLALVVRAGAGVQHDRRRGRVAPRHLRLELPGQERRRGRRARLRPAPRARSPHSRQRRRRCAPASGTRRSTRRRRALRARRWAHRLRSDRPRDGHACASVRHARRRLEPPASATGQPTCRAWPATMAGSDLEVALASNRPRMSPRGATSSACTSRSTTETTRPVNRTCLTG